MAHDDAWKFPRQGDCCAACRQPLLPGARCTTVIRLLPEGPVRDDLCAACGQVAVAAPDVCFWSRTRPEVKSQRTVVDYAMLRELFGRLLQRSDDVYRRLAYLVALVLIRKRHLRLQGFVRRSGREVMLVNRGAGQPTLDVPAPLLSMEDLLVVREQLARLLNTDLAEHDLPELSALRAEAEGGAAAGEAGVSDRSEASAPSS